jgi:hypothetical protein
LEDDEHADRPRMVRTELGIQEATLVHANCPQTVDEIAATASGISCATCHRILSDDLNMLPSTVFHSARCKTGVMIARTLAVTWIDSADKDRMFLNRIVTGDEM